ncbi:MAG: TetR/AcrR family transcriptional regulator [Acidobacteria bacterium]|nr:TetR/AcrR family transcriptional regulator [Acidobacteriota bacterium]
MTTVRRQQRQREWEALTRRAIEEAVVRLLTKSGSQGFTMEQVAAEAGVAKGTLYLHFKGKKDLLDQVKEASLAPLREELEAIFNADLGPQEKIRELVANQLRYFDERRDLFKVLLEERQVAQLQRTRQQNSRYKYILGRIASVVEEGMRIGVFRSLEAAKVAAMLFEASIAVIGQRLWSDHPAPWEEDARFLVEVFVHGIAARPSSRERTT